MEIKVKFIGIDSWSREVYQNIENGRIYKKYSGENTYYTSDEFEGEPDFPLKEGVKVVVVNE